MKNGLKIIRLMIGILFLLFILPVFLSPQQEHEKIVEEVHVKWWQVPVFAVDNAGNPVTNLEPGDIEIILNGRIIPEFILEKRPFQVTEMKETIIPHPEVPRARQAIRFMKSKVILLLFDLTLSRASNIIRSKKIAREIIMEAEQGTHFFLLTIEPFKGLNYICEGIDNRDEN